MQYTVAGVRHGFESFPSPAHVETESLIDDDVVDDDVVDDDDGDDGEEDEVVGSLMP